jgi:hypothetical protein
VEFIGRPYAIAAVLVVIGLVLARAVAVYSTGWALHGVSSRQRELMMFLFPRGLVNAVLAIQVAGYEAEMAFLPAMAFTVILITNLIMVLGAFRCPPGSSI